MRTQFADDELFGLKTWEASWGFQLRCTKFFQIFLLLSARSQMAAQLVLAVPTA